MVGQHEGAVQPDVADHSLEHIVGQLVAHVGALGDQGLAIDRLGVHQQAVHVEDDGFDGTRQGHGVDLSRFGRAASHTRFQSVTNSSAR